ncbi:MAG: hypothetical protein U1F36_09165 [Planctomycetota bacterium]
MLQLPFRSLALMFLCAACSSTTSTKPAENAPAPHAVEVVQATFHVGDAIERPGFVTSVEDGRLWVLRTGTEKSEKCVTWIGAGPRGMTLRACDADTALAYLGARPGFSTEVEDGRLWVLRDGQSKGEKRVTRIGAGPRGCTVLAVDRETLDAWLAAR